MMPEGISALLVHDEAEPLGALKATLEAQSVATQRARSCQEAAMELGGVNPPHLVFTDTTLADGTWADVVGLAVKAPVPVDVIVVARLVDMTLYVDVIHRGAFDFLAPPFVPSDLAHVVRCAGENVLSRRKARGNAA